MCKACERTFNSLTGTPLAGLRLRQKWLDYARALVDGVSLRKAAARTDIHLETSLRWRHRFLAAVQDKKAAAATGIVEADETFILQSAKRSSAGRPGNSAERPRNEGFPPTSTMPSDRTGPSWRDHRCVAEPDFA